MSLHHQPPKQRKSTETERQQLLLPHTNDDASSIAPSSSASMIYSPSEAGNDERDGERTPRAHSPAREATNRPYRGFPSEAAYLAALQEWVEGKKYSQTDTMLIGFYGQKTQDEIASRPPPEIGLGLRKKWKARKVRKAEERRASVLSGGDSEVGSEDGRERRNTVA